MKETFALKSSCERNVNYFGSVSLHIDDGWKSLVIRVSSCYIFLIVLPFVDQINHLSCIRLLFVRQVLCSSTRR